MAYVFKDREPPQEWSRFKARTGGGWLTPFHALSWLADWAAYFLAKWPMVELLEYLGSFSILFAVIFYFAGASDRVKQKHYQAWQVINTAQGKGGNGGRIDALQELNEDHVSLIGVNVADAYLEGLELPKARLRRSNFSGCDLRHANFQHADLEDANFYYANFREADLRGCHLAGCDLGEADFTDANLAGADLADTVMTNVSFVGANLANASLTNADLRGADLENISHWESIRSIARANIFDVHHAPAGFVVWARQKGAIEKSGPSSK
jgi:hypothetical protein